VKAVAKPAAGPDIRQATSDLGGGFAYRMR